MTGIELLIVFGSAFGLGLIPFGGPSNLLVAYNWALAFHYTDPLNLTLVGLIVALGVSLAKGIHYMVTFFISGHLSEKTQKRLNTDAVKVRKWAFLLLFAAASTPIPDEPVVIPLGLMKYSPIKFFAAFFLGKLTITVAGAFLGFWLGGALSEWLSPTASIVLSIALTIIVTIILLKVDVGKITEQIAQKFQKGKPKESEKLTIPSSTEK
jgi:membrane protein DedA with SNARE-associated domain